MRPTRLRTAVGLAVSLSLLTAGIASADNLVVDGDMVSPSGTAIAFGTVCVGADATRPLAVSIERQGNGNVFANGASVSITGSGPTGTSTAPTAITLPTDWVGGSPSGDNGATAGPVTTQVTLTTDTPRAVAGTLTVTASGAKSGGGDLSRSAGITVTGTVVACTPADTTPPLVTPTVVGTLGDNGWFTSDVALTWAVIDTESSLTTTGCGAVAVVADQDDTTYTCTASSAGGTAEQSVTIRRDATAPTILGTRTPAANADGWNNTAVDVAFDCADATSGMASCGPDGTLRDDGAAQSLTGTAVDRAGNTATATVDGISIDRTAPTVSVVAAPTDGAVLYPHQAAAMTAPTCLASDALSGLAGDCTVAGFGRTVGAHTVTATATDRADNVATASVAWTVAPYGLAGFHAPVDMGGVVNTVKSGSTVPLKFEVFAGGTEMTDTAVVDGVRSVLSTCDGQAVEDAIEATATGSTSLRYDTTAGQFVHNWQTPRNRAGACYRVTVTLVGGQTITASFRLK